VHKKKKKKKRGGGGGGGGGGGLCRPQKTKVTLKSFNRLYYFFISYFFLNLLRYFS